MTATRFLLGVAFGALLGVGIGRWWWPSAAATPAPAASAAGEVVTVEPGKVELDDAIVQKLGIVTAAMAEAGFSPAFAAPGLLVADPDAAFVVRCPLPGRLAAGPRPIPRIGDTVEAETVVAVLVPRLGVAERADLEQRRAQARADVEVATGALSAANKELARVQALHSDGNAASQRAVEQAEVEQRSLVARQAQAQHVLQSLPDTGPASIALVVPRGGIVDDVAGHVGEEMDAGAIVLQGSEPGRLLARIDVPVGADVDPGFENARVELLGARPTMLPGQRIAWAPSSGVHRTVVLAVRAAADVRPGWPILAHLPGRGPGRTGTLLPEASILRRGDGTWVFVRKSGAGGKTVFQRLAVRLDAPAPNGWYATLHDLAPAAGTELVVEGAAALLSVERRRSSDAEAGG